MPRQLAPALLLVLTLAGCAQAASDGVSPLGSPTPSEPTPTPPGPSADPSEIRSLELRLWLPAELSPAADRPEAAVLAQQLEDFAASYPSLTVEITEKHSEGEGSLLRFLLAARDAAPSVMPDLVIVDSADLQTVYDAGLAQPVEGLLSQQTLDDQFPFAAQLATIDDQQFGFVFGAEVLHAAYRPALLATPPLSWTQVTSERISYLFPAAGQNGLANEATLVQYLAASNQPAPAEGGPALDGDALEDLLAFYSDAVDQAAVSPAAVLAIGDPDDAWTRFTAGEGDLTVVRSSRYWREADDTMAPAQLPTQDGTPATLARGWVVVLITESPQRQSAALALVEQLSAPEAHAAWTRAAGYLPATNEALQLWGDSAEDRALLRALMNAAGTSSGLTTGASQAIQVAVEAVLLREETPAQAAAAALETVGQ
jgi:ABC-type glycerol-3-phosphate transport system substrate-binding protein